MPCPVHLAGIFILPTRWKHCLVNGFSSWFVLRHYNICDLLPKGVARLGPTCFLIKTKKIKSVLCFHDIECEDEWFGKLHEHDWAAWCFVFFILSPFASEWNEYRPMKNGECSTRSTKLTITIEMYILYV